MPRRLASFLVADAVGYSARVEANEAKAIAALSNTLDTINEALRRHGGKTVATGGDSVIAMFDTSVDAVKSALDIQIALAARQTDVFALRIGIHFGDVSDDGENLLGDGLNVAARLEPLAPKGGILITNVVADQIVGKVDDRFAPVGKHKVKNISRPLELYGWPVQAARRHRRRRLLRHWPVAAAVLVVLAVALGWALRPDPSAQAQALREVVAVLPFQNAGNQPSGTVLSQGLAQDLTVRLAEISGVNVVPSSLAFSVTEHGMEAIAAARSLGARYIVDGSVHVQESDLRITVELIDGSKETIVWASGYDGSSGQLVEFRNNIIRNIATEIGGKITESDLDRLDNTGTENPDAYKEIILGRQAASAFSLNSSVQAERHFLKAIEMDPSYARAYAELAAIYAIRLENGWTVLNAADEQKALFFVEKALSIDPDLWLAHYAAGRLHSIITQDDFSKAEYHLERAMALQPANDDARIYYAAVKTFQGKAEEAVAIAEPIVAAHPNPPFWYHLTLGNAYFQTRDHEAAEKSFDRCLSQMSLSPYCLRFQIANLGAMGRTDDALWLLDEYTLLGFDTTVSAFMGLSLVADPGYRQFMENSLRAAGLSE